MAIVTGTLNGSTKTNIVNGGRTEIVTLTSDFFDSSLGDDNAITTAYINGLVSAQSEAGGWNAQVLPLITFADVTRNSATLCTIVLPAVPGYDITANETLTHTIPAAALFGGFDIVATPTLKIIAGAAHHINDCKLAYYEAQLAKTGQRNDLELEWLQSVIVSLPTPATLNDAWYQFLTEQLVPVGQLNDMKVAWLKTVATGETLNDLELDYYCNVVAP